MSRSIGAPLPTDIGQILNALVAAGGTGSFSGLEVGTESNYGSTVAGTYVGDAPLQLGDTLSYETAQDFGSNGNPDWQNVTFTFTIASLVTTGKSTAGPSCCPPGTYWNGNACIHQVTLQQGGQQGGNQGGGPFQVGGTHLPVQNQGGTGTQPPAGSSNKGYYIAAGVVAALGIGTALVLWKVAP